MSEAAPPTSTKRSTPRPADQRRTSTGQSAARLSTIRFAPAASRWRRLLGLDVVAATSAPWALANNSANMDTPPVPSTSTVSPATSGAGALRADQAVTAAQGKVAASA